MKGFLLTIMLALFVAAVTVAPVAAEGDKVHGDEGVGPTNSFCLNFGECPYDDGI